MDLQTQQSIFREMGSMEARIGNIEIDVAEVKTDLREVKSAVSTVPSLSSDVSNLKSNVQILIERNAIERGGRSMLWKVGASSSAGGGLLVALATYIHDLIIR